MVTEAQKRAIKKWDNKYEVVRFRVEKGKKKQISEFASSKGLSVNSLINKLIEETMQQNNKQDSQKEKQK